MLMKWEDLLPGDKVKLTEQFEKMDSYKPYCGILTILWIKEESSSTLRIFTNKSDSGFVINKETGCRNGDNYPLLEVVELCEEN